MLRTLAASVATAATAVALTAVPGAAATSAPPEPPGPGARADRFYQVPRDLSGPPGRVLKQQPSTFYLDPVSAQPAPADAQRIMYTSRDTRGGRTAVTGTLLTPPEEWAGPGRRPLVSFAVGTQGMADRCAPSRQLAAGSEYEGGFISGYLLAGYAVVVTDYQGLGTPGTHAYVDSRALGRNVLDAARAATRVDVDPVPRRAPVYLAGYSEGGNAVGGALEQRPRYAPRVPVAGAYAGAVPADLARVAPPLDGSLYAAFLLYAVAALDDGYPGLGVADLLNRDGRRAVRQAGRTCLTDGLTAFAGTDSRDLTRSGSPVAALLERPRFARVLERLRIGDVAPDVPVVVAHSRFDDVVPFGQARDAVEQWCDLGATVAFRRGVVPTHVGGAVESYPKAFGWVAARVLGVPAPSTCDRG